MAPERASAESLPRSSSLGESYYDATIIGGGLAGSSAAILLRRFVPESKILVVERAEKFPLKVGEATVEISALFLHRVLGLYDHLAREHLLKHGLRFWFTDEPDRALEEMTEVGPAEIPTLPAFQIDRSILDEHLLTEAGREGCEIARPARVLSVVHDWPISAIELETANGDQRKVKSRWVIDASGRHAFLARRLRLLKRSEQHPIDAMWARWTGVKDLDGWAVKGANPRSSRLPHLAASRRLGTNHFCGYGWWCWLIPLASGLTSVGLVFNKELFRLPGEGSSEDRFLQFVRSQAGLRELLEEATPCENDFHSYRHLPYATSQYMGRGWALVGDAASFLDPLYSPGLDHAAISTYATVQILENDLGGALNDEALDRRISEHNKIFARSYGRWLDALYVGKYELLGDAELTGCAYLVDTALYYLGMVTPAYSHLEALANPAFGISLPQAGIAYRLVRTFNRRLQRLAKLRKRTGLYGRRNVGWRLQSSNFGPGWAALAPLGQGLLLWLRLELRQLARSLLRIGPRAQPTRVTDP